MRRIDQNPFIPCIPIQLAVNGIIIHEPNIDLNTVIQTLTGLGKIPDLLNCTGIDFLLFIIPDGVLAFNQIFIFHNHTTSLIQ